MLRPPIWEIYTVPDEHHCLNVAEWTMELFPVADRVHLFPFSHVRSDAPRCQKVSGP